MTPQPKGRPPNANPPGPKVLVIRLSAMGDLVVTTPVLRTLHQQFNAEVHLVTKAAFAPILRHLPYVRKIHIWSDEVVPALRAEGFELVVDLHGSIRSHLLRVRLGVPAVGFRKRNVEKRLLARGIDLLGDEHLVDRYFRGLRSTGVRDDGRGLDYAATTAELAAAAAHTDAVAGAYVALVLGATHYTKRMPADLVAAVVAALERPVVLLGGPDVVELADEVLALLGLPVGTDPTVGTQATDGATARPAPVRVPQVLNLCGALPLRDSIAVLAKAEAVIAGDTGLMHVAAALHKPMVVVWGNTAPAIGMYPWYPRGLTDRYRNAEVRGLGCRPCSRIGFAACPLGHFRCMRDQDARSIVAQLGEVLASRPVAAATVENRAGT